MYKGLAPVPALHKVGVVVPVIPTYRRETEPIQVILSCMYIELKGSLDYIEVLSINKCVCVCVCCVCV